MISSIMVLRWNAVPSPAASGIEILGARSAPYDVGLSLDSLCARISVTDASFVLVRLDPTDHDGVQAALAQASACSNLADTRVCLAIDRWTLSRVDPLRLDTTRAGLLLDDVDAETPLSALAHEAIEAIRFRSEFVGSAVDQLRLGCALAACVTLASSLGLATLGPAVSKSRPMPGLAFDYVPSETNVANDEEWTTLPWEASRRQQELQLG